MKCFTIAVVIAYLCAVTYGHIIAAPGYGGSQQFSSVEERSSVSNVQQGGLGLGGYGSSSVQTYSSKTVRSSSSIVSQWPQLGGHPWFGQLCGCASTYKSAAIAQHILPSGFNFESTFTELYQKNSFLEQYIFATTGIRYEASSRSRFFGIIQQNPGSFLRNLRYFARHPGIFNCQLGQTLISTTSIELFQSYNQQTALSFFQQGYGLNNFLEYPSYRNKLARIFGCQAELNILRQHIHQSYQRNALGTLLLFRHIITRKSLFSHSEYLGFNYQSYSSRSTSRIWKHNPYYDLWHGAGGLTTGASSFQESYESSSVSSSAIGGLGGYGSSVQSESYSKLTRSSSTIISQWPQLGGHPWFGQLCGIASTFKSAGIAQQLIQPGFNFESTFSELYQRNSYLEHYIYATTGIRYEASSRSRFFGIIQQNPGSFLRNLRYFARHPGIFNCQLGQTLISTTSIELFQSYNQQTALSFFQQGYGLNNFLEYTSYRTSLARVFGCQPDVNILRQYIHQSYQRNALGTLLLFRHIITRKTLYSHNEYLGFNYQSYSSRYASQRIWRHNPYYDLWNGAGGLTTGASSFQESYESKSVSSSAIGGLGGYGSSVQSESYSKITRSSSTIISQWPQLGGHPWFGQLCGIASTYKSAGIAQQLIQPGFNFESTFSELYQRNSYLEHYIYATTGIRYDASSRSRFFGIIQKSPGSFLRNLRYFARHPGIFNCQLGQTLISTTSIELFQSYNQQTALSFFQQGYGLNNFLEYTSYRTSLARVFGCQPDVNILRQYIHQSYQRNALGTLLLFRHIITRKTLYSHNEYLGFNYQSYSSRYASQRIWRHNPYYDLWNGAGGLTTGASSFQESYESSSVSSSAIGGLGGYGSSVQSESYSKLTRSSSTILPHWQQLGNHPWFGQVCGIASTFKSAGIAQQLIQPGFNFESTFSELYQRNSFLEHYMFATTGIRYDASSRSRFFGLIQQNPGCFLRNLRYFARHPGIFNSQLGQTLISTTSIELFQSYNQQTALSFFQQGYGLDSFLEYSSYRTSLASVFGCQPDINILRQYIHQSYQRNAIGTLLLFRHIITRKTLYSYNEYLGFNHQVYSSRYASRSIWRRNPYIDQWRGGGFGGSSFGGVSSSSFKRSSSAIRAIRSRGIGC